MVVNNAQDDTGDEKQANDGGEQGNSFGYQATPPYASNGFGIEDTHLVINDAQDDTCDKNKPMIVVNKAVVSAIKLHLQMMLKMTQMIRNKPTAAMKNLIRNVRR